MIQHVRPERDGKQECVHAAASLHREISQELAVARPGFPAPAMLPQSSALVSRGSLVGTFLRQQSWNVMEIHGVCIPLKPNETKKFQYVPISKIELNDWSDSVSPWTRHVEQVQHTPWPDLAPGHHQA